MLSLLSIPLAYLLGSISSTYIVGRLVGNVDMRTEDDGRISAAAMYRRFGLIPFLVVVIMDMGMAALAVIIAKMLTESLEIVLVAGFATVVGHNWSVFLRFKGGLGATAIGECSAASYSGKSCLGLQSPDLFCLLHAGQD